MKADSHVTKRKEIWTPPLKKIKIKNSCQRLCKEGNSQKNITENVNEKKEEVVKFKPEEMNNIHF